MGGQAFSKLRGSLVTRPIQRFNIENRTEKLLSKDKPKSAPKFAADANILEEIRKTRPDIAEATSKKDVELLARLKDVYVASSDPHDFDPDINRKLPVNPDRPLPGKFVRGNPSGGFAEASRLFGKTPPGKLSVSDVEDILAKLTEANRESALADEVLKTHELEKDKLSDLLRYHSIFLLIPKTEVKEKEEEVPDHNRVGEDWQTLEDSDIHKKSLEVKSNTIKSLPNSSSQR